MLRVFCLHLISTYQVGDCIRLDADVYRYMKHGSGGKLIDYALENPRN